MERKKGKGRGGRREEGKIPENSDTGSGGQH